MTSCNTNRMDINGRLVLLLVRFHAKHISNKLLICLVEVRWRHYDGSSWKHKRFNEIKPNRFTLNQLYREHLLAWHNVTWPYLFHSHRLLEAFPTLFTSADIQHTGALAITIRHAKACIIWVDGCVGKHLGGGNESIPRDPLHCHVAVIQSVQGPLKQSHMVVNFWRQKRVCCKLIYWKAQNASQAESTASKTLAVLSKPQSAFGWPVCERIDKEG